MGHRPASELARRRALLLLLLLLSARVPCVTRERSITARTSSPDAGSYAWSTECLWACMAEQFCRGLRVVVTRKRFRKAHTGSSAADHGLSGCPCGGSAELKIWICCCCCCCCCFSVAQSRKCHGGYISSWRRSRDGFRQKRSTNVAGAQADVSTRSYRTSCRAAAIDEILGSPCIGCELTSARPSLAVSGVATRKAGWIKSSGPTSAALAHEFRTVFKINSVNFIIVVHLRTWGSGGYTQTGVQKYPQSETQHHFY